MSPQTISAQTIESPLSLAETRRLAATADTVLLSVTREADLETPISAFLALDDGSPAFLLESVEGAERIGRYSFLGIRPRRTLEVHTGDPLDALRAFMPSRRVASATPHLPRFSGGAVGVLAYDAVSAFEPTVRLPERDPVGVPLAAFMETDLLIVFDRLAQTLSAIAPLHTHEPDLAGRYARAERQMHDALQRASRPAAHPPAVSTMRAPSIDSPDRDVNLSERAYLEAVASAKESITAGECIQVVLARRRSMPVPATRAGPLTGIAIYRALRRVSPSPYLFYLRLPTFELIGASPELLVRVEGGHVTTHPIAGTRPRGATPHDDAELAAQLLADPKERAEHVMLVDLARNDLGRVARPGTVRVPDYMEVERFSHVQHIVSHVQAELRPDADAIDALRAVFPAGTLSGAPKVRAMQLIGELEDERRGIYGGAVGYLGYDGSLDTCIAIRSAVLTRGRMHLHSGAGIVAGSDPQLELAETTHKAAAMDRALALAGAVQVPSNGVAA